METITKYCKEPGCETLSFNDYCRVHESDNKEIRKASMKDTDIMAEKLKKMVMGVRETIFINRDEVIKMIDEASKEE